MKDDDEMPRKEEKPKATQTAKETKDDGRKMKVNEYIAITQGLSHYEKAMLELSRELKTEAEWAKHLESLKGKKE